MKVEIYVAKSCKSPRRTKGIYGYVLVYRNPEGKEATKTLFREIEATAHEAELIVAVEAMKALKVPCEVEIITEDNHIEQTMAAGWLERWKNNQWKNAKGKPVGNVELWQQYEELIQKHSVAFSKNGSFKNWLEIEIEKRGKEI